MAKTVKTTKENTKATAQTVSPAPEKKKSLEEIFAETVVPKGYKCNMYDLAKVLKKYYEDGGKSALTIKQANKENLSMVLLKAWWNDCSDLLNRCAEYIRTKHGGDVATATKLRKSLSAHVLKLFNRHFVEDTEGFYEFNSNDVENVIAAAETWEKVGRRIEGVSMPLEQRVSIATEETFRANIERLFMFKILGKKVISDERRDALSTLDGITKKAHEPKKQISALQSKIAIMTEMRDMTEDAATHEKFQGIIDKAEKEIEALNKVLEEIKKEAVAFCATMPSAD